MEEREAKREKVIQNERKKDRIDTAKRTDEQGKKQIIQKCKRKKKKRISFFH